MNNLLVLRVLLAGIAAFHLVVGLAATTVPPGDFADSIISASYGASFEIDPVAHHIIRILGAFMLFVGVMAVFATIDPQRNKPAIYTLMSLFILRALQRMVFFGEISDNFDISTLRLVTQSVFFVLLAVALFLLRLRSERVSV